MAFDPATEMQVLRYLRGSAWNDRPCYVCGNNDWAVHGHVTLSLGNVAGQAAFGGQAMPCAALICQRCGNTLLINLAITGVVPRG